VSLLDLTSLGRKGVWRLKNWFNVSKEPVMSGAQNWHVN